MKRAKTKASASSAIPGDSGPSSLFVGATGRGGDRSTGSPPKKKKVAVPDPSIIITNTSDGPQQQFQCKVCGRFVVFYYLIMNTIYRTIELRPFRALKR